MRLRWAAFVGCSLLLVCCLRVDAGAVGVVWFVVSCGWLFSVALFSGSADFVFIVCAFLCYCVDGALVCVWVGGFG